MASITNHSDDSHKYNDDIPLERRHSINSTDSDPVGVYFVRSKQALCVESMALTSSSMVLMIQLVTPDGQSFSESVAAWCLR